MKRTVSRASKLSIDFQDKSEFVSGNTITGIPDAKWQELLEREETDLFILGIREEILTNCLDICYKSYMEKQAVAFTVHCAYLAWVKVIGIYYMFRDPGDMEDPEIKKTWEPDEEPQPSMIDSWGGQCIKVAKPEEPPSSVDEESTQASESLDRQPFSSYFHDFFGGEENDDYAYPSHFEESEAMDTWESLSLSCSSLRRAYLLSKTDGDHDDKMKGNKKNQSSNKKK